MPVVSYHCKLWQNFSGCNHLQCGRFIWLFNHCTFTFRNIAHWLAARFKKIVNLFWFLLNGLRRTFSWNKVMKKIVEQKSLQVLFQLIVTSSFTSLRVFVDSAPDLNIKQDRYQVRLSPHWNKRPGCLDFQAIGTSARNVKSYVFHLLTVFTNRLLNNCLICSLNKFKKTLERRIMPFVKVEP